ncbi:MAG: hypothetical protein HKP30_00035, partial [Myxococcales bacterium]|nr:hypothetical protein [Myxococcales bacterium]
YTKLEREGVTPAWPFGAGLSYTRFGFADARAALAPDGETIQVSVDVANEGDRAGECVVQVYAGWAETDEAQPRKRLCGFTRVALAPGGTTRAQLRVALADLAWFDAEARRWRLGARDWTIHVGGSSAAADLATASIALPERSWSIAER